MELILISLAQSSLCATPLLCLASPQQPLAQPWAVIDRRTTRLHSSWLDLTAP